MDGMLEGFNMNFGHGKNRYTVSAVSRAILKLSGSASGLFFLVERKRQP